MRYDPGVAVIVSPRSQLAAPSAPFFHGAVAKSIEVHPQGRLLLVTSRDVVRLMRADSGESVLTLPEIPERRWALGRFVFLPDGRIAGCVSSMDEKPLTDWKMLPGGLVFLLIKAVGRPISF